jgi:hypothetical protein
MIPAQTSTAQEMEAVARILGLKPTDLRHVLQDSGSFDALNGVPVACPTINIPPGRALLVTHLNIESLPYDSSLVSVPLFAQRQQGGFVDATRLFFSLDGAAQLPQSLDYRNLSGNVWLPFPSGALVISVKVGAVGPATPVQLIAVTVSGFVVPEACYNTLINMATRRL